MKSKGKSPAVQAANTLTARWCSRLLGDEDYALSGRDWQAAAGAARLGGRRPSGGWAGNGSGPAGRRAQQEALEIIDLLRGGRSTSAALGIWTRKHVPLDEHWASPLPDGVVNPGRTRRHWIGGRMSRLAGSLRSFPSISTTKPAGARLGAHRPVRWHTPFEGTLRGRKLGVIAEDERRWRIWSRCQTIQVSRSTVTSPDDLRPVPQPRSPMTW